ncbi:MAG: putative lipopolysaccharide heptosyltransferase III [Methylovulum sp.]
MSHNKSLSKEPKKILVIALRYLGDVLLTTPLLHSLRQGYPNAELDILVFQNTAAMLEGNPDIDHIITTPNHPNFADYRQLLARLFRRYDLSLTMQTGDRPLLYSLIAAPLRVAVVPPKHSRGWWKRFFVQCWIEFDNDNTHTVLQNLKLLDVLNIPWHFSLIPPKTDDVEKLTESWPFLSDNNYAVLHVHPQWNYKRWTVAGWVEIGNFCKKSGLKVVLSGGPAPEEIDYVASIAEGLSEDTINLAGKLSLAQLAYIMSKAKLFIGPDTGITHLAAATGIPVVAIYGPTNPVKWAPWPNYYQQNKNPFNRIGDQQVNNIFLMQGKGKCVPCHLEGCDRHRQSHSLCLDNLSVDGIKKTIEQILNSLP